jgi:hypothetical protein
MEGWVVRDGNATIPSPNEMPSVGAPLWVPGDPEIVLDLANPVATIIIWSTRYTTYAIESDWWARNQSGVPTRGSPDARWFDGVVVNGVGSDNPSIAAEPWESGLNAIAPFKLCCHVNPISEVSV